MSLKYPPDIVQSWTTFTCCTIIAVVNFYKRLKIEINNSGQTVKCSNLVITKLNKAEKRLIAIGNIMRPFI